MLRTAPLALALAAPLAGLGCASAPHAPPRPLIEPVFSYTRQGLHPADAKRLPAGLEAASTGKPRVQELALR